MEQERERFDRAARFLPERLRRRATELPERAKAQAEEFRLRRGQPLFLTYSWGEESIAGTQVSAEDIEAVLTLASGASVHTVLEQVKHGFMSLPGGHRLGLCGTCVVEEGAIRNLRDFSSLCLRIAKERRDAAETVVKLVCGKDGVKNTLILSPPGGGKTTLLRDLIRRVSSGEGCLPRRVGVVDERGELAGMAEGRATLEIGARSDVMDRVPKELGISLLLKGMNPQIIALDEVTEEADLRAMGKAAGCGVKLFATAHAGSFEDLRRRKAYRALLDMEIMERFVLIGQVRGRREYTVLNEAGERIC